MCGIAGIFNSSLDDKALHSIGKRMAQQIYHRGPDGNGIVIRKRKSGGRVLLVHTRLSIIDLTEAATQPMVFEDKGLSIVFNGEIYNFQELRLILVAEGYVFRSKSDTEVILASYHCWGIKCFDRFIGMWAIAIFDEHKDNLILSRDRLGIKPLYYARQGNTWVFGSEPKIIVEQIPETKRLNHQAVSDYFSYRYVLGGKSFYKGINSVSAGTHLIISSKTFREVKYWDLPIVIDKYDPGEKKVREDLENLMESAVSYRMISDVPVGSFLSGGLDSSILVQIMTQQHTQPIKTFTIGFPESGFNEFEYAEEVARHCNTDHKQITLNSEQYIDAMHTMLKIKDAPLSVPNEIAVHKLSKELKKDMSVGLSGEGAEELFGGYGRIFRSAFDYQRVSKLGVNNLSKSFQTNLLKKYNNLNWPSELDHFLGQYSYLDFSQKEQIINPEILNGLGDDPHNINFFQNLWTKLDGLDLHEKYMWIFQKVHLEGLLGRLDSASMSASVEGRVPFVDHRLIEYVNALPLHYKMRWAGKKEEYKANNLNSNQISEKLDITKYLLRTQYEARLPKRITSRDKVGFPVPLGKWLSGPLRDYARKQLTNPNARSRDLFQTNTIKNLLDKGNFDSKAGLNIWMLLNVEEWMQIYDVTL